RNADPGALSARARRSGIPPDGQRSVTPRCDSEVAPPAPLWLLRGEGRGVARVLAVDRVDHVLEDVGGVVADALERLGDEQEIEAARDGARVLVHIADHAAQHAAERCIELLFARRSVGDTAGVELVEGA